MHYQLSLPNVPSYTPENDFDRLLTCLSVIDENNNRRKGLRAFAEARKILEKMGLEQDPKTFFYNGLLRDVYAKGVCASPKSYFSYNSNDVKGTQLKLDI